MRVVSTLYARGTAGWKQICCKFSSFHKLFLVCMGLKLRPFDIFQGEARDRNLVAKSFLVRLLTWNAGDQVQFAALRQAGPR